MTYKEIIIVVLIVGILGSIPIIYFGTILHSADTFSDELTVIGIQVIHIQNVADIQVLTTVDRGTFMREAIKTNIVYTDGFQFAIFTNEAQTVAMRYFP